MPLTLIKFIRAAKLATYAAQGDSATVASLLPSTKQLEYENDEYLYRDVYAGMEFFVGQELVYEAGAAVWSMSYSGGVIVSATEAAMSEVYRFLRTALLQTTAELPLRGPRSLRAGQFHYSCAVAGQFTRFQGTELISIADSPVYELHFSGGTLR